MRKKGFTLAEVLITLGIIGVVAALTAPILQSSVQQSKVGPALSKFINSLEVAHEHILADNQADTISSVAEGDVDVYYEELSKYAKGLVSDKKLGEYPIVPANYNGKTDGDGSPMLEEGAKDFAVFEFADGSAMTLFMYEPGTLRGGSYKGGVASVWVDINGFNTKPNRAGKDEFRFYIDDSGAVYPDGGNVKKQLVTKNGAPDIGNYWNEDTGRCDETAVKRGGVFCGASVVDNNFKVIYKY